MILLLKTVFFVVSGTDVVLLPEIVFIEASGTCRSVLFLVILVILPEERLFIFSFIVESVLILLSVDIIMFLF